MSRVRALAGLGIDPLPPAPRPVNAPDVTALYAHYRGLVERVRAMADGAKASRARVITAQAFGGVGDPAWVAEVPGARAMSLPDADLEMARVLGELAKHAELVAGVEARRLRVVPSASTPGDIDIVTPGASGNVGELGIWPLLVAGAAVLGRVVIAAAVTAIAYRTYEHLEFRTKSRLLEQGQDITKLEPPPDFGAKVAKVTTPLAIAAGVVGAALLVKAWKAK